MLVQDIQSLQNTGTEESLSSLSLFIIMLIFGSIFAAKKTHGKIHNKPLYTRLNPQFFMPGFTTVEKFDFEPPKKQINLWNHDKIQTKFDPKNFSK
ncbi:MAG: hypothetical protein JW985_01005 [Alphaproteobacteria bacterium]|nr:hypothetical protein [Alphaproteobacteria bacterium]